MKPGPVLVAVSGGLDSTVLLHLLHGMGTEHGLELLVAHLDHGIHPASERVAAGVEQLARSLGLRCIRGCLELGADASETEARQGRARWLEAARVEAGANYILLAHQADDQAETVVMRFLRGSGPAGLAGMPARRRSLVRPLLPFTRASILRYAQAHHLEWWEDPANQDPRHLRSWIRTDLLPTLASRLPDISARVRSVRRHAAADRQAWSAALREWPGLDYRQEPGSSSLSWPVLSSLPPGLQSSLVRTMSLLAGHAAGMKRIQSALRTLQGSQSGSTLDLAGGWVLELAFDRLRLVSQAEGAAVADVAIAGSSGAVDWGGFEVRWSAERAPSTQPRDGNTAWFIPGTLVLRTWRAGDRLFPLGGRGRRLAVRCFQDARVGSRERRSWPILEGAGELAWIPGVCRSDRLLPAPGAPSLRVDVARRG